MKNNTKHFILLCCIKYMENLKFYHYYYANFKFILIIIQYSTIVNDNF